MTAPNHNLLSPVESEPCLPKARPPEARGENVIESARNGCPPVEHLWPAAVGELASEPVAKHLAGCGACRRRTVQLAGEIEEARRLLADRQPPDNADSDRNGNGGDPCRHETTVPERHMDGADRSSVRAGATRPLAVIGKYFVLESICESGQATVFRGLHPSLLVDVVIKLAHRPWRRDETGRARLVSEARALAEIVHPHLARLYDLDFYDDRPFLVLEYVRGRHLGHYRESTALEASRIACLVAKVARAVSAAHERRILHLDLKPENILITTTGEPVLIDFGLSFLSCSSVSRSIEGRCVAGTPEYMAPEQAEGHRDALTQRTDVFGLGGVLYYLCVGKDPFAVSNGEGRWERPAEPDWRALDRADVPARLKSICRKALSAEPDSRYATAEQLAETLEDAGRRWTVPALTRLRRIAGALFVLGAACLVSAGIPPADTPPDQAQLRVRAARGGSDVPLPDGLPLRVGDQLRLEGFVRESAHVALLSVNAAQTPQWFGPLQITPDGGGAQIAYPRFRDTFPVCDGPGTVLVLLVSRRQRPIRRQDAVDLIPSPMLFALLPEQAIATFGRQHCDISANPGTSLTQQQRSLLQQHIQSLQGKLSDRFDDFAGILAVATAGESQGQSPQQHSAARPAPASGHVENSGE